MLGYEPMTFGYLRVWKSRGSTCYRSPHVSSYSRATAAFPQAPQHSGFHATELTGTLAACLNELQATLQAVRAHESTNTNFNENSVPLSAAQEESSTRAPSEIEDASPSREADEVEDAATILEFLAWGRRKVPDFDDLVGNPNSDLAQSPGDVSLLNSPADPPQLRFTDDASSLPLLQLLLPEPPTLLRMVNYHCECLLWYHSAFHGRIFLEEVDRFLKQHHGCIDNQQIDLQWVALLFAVLAGTMTCAPRPVSTSWGFEHLERTNLAHRFFKAALVCLNLADFTARHSLYGIECIATMTISAHLLGHSNSHSVKLASAVRISQSLGMHRLGEEIDGHPKSLVRREIGRRLWTELCIQDWFSIPFSESYLIHRRDFNTGKPRNCMDDIEMTTLSDNVPTPVTYHRFLYEIAALMPQLQDDLSASHTLFAKYEHVIRYDTKMRTLVSKHVPSCLRNTALEPSWPRYVPWARHCLTISSAHKIIMIHRKFLWSSFTNPAFTFTRKTCIAAAKTITREQKQLVKEDGPVLWIYHAFSVAASIILCLDLFFDPLPDCDQEENRELVKDMIGILSQSDASMIATRGVKILRLLLNLEQDHGKGLSGGLNIRGLVKYICENEALVSRSDEWQHDAPPVNGPPSPMSTMQMPGFIPRESHTEELYGNVTLPNSRFGMPDSLEDILLLVQNGGE
ncbi:uncharacterized protein N7484_003958 [Penicillium longicatenatum]|uniref:uncharacterized protein n=1 Tax=Penicillium longicatenatum TaxID=1561947 RepID=UPI002546C673|nr:uncharacterized protein N7484_003958 [Penicillium longicatenatum]KAJ5650235.1 hypothetical protein N7484_003958 [Penicillium longicatenatum]